MSTLRTLNIDDEPLALSLISSHIAKTPFLEHIGEFLNPLEALSYLQDHHVDLLFLDIEMPDLRGTDFARTVDKNTMIIFTTAYKEYAFEGFELNAIDYLHKPISYHRFLTAAQKANKIFQLKNSTSTTEVERHKTDFFVKTNGKLQRIQFSSILYFEGLKDYIKLYVKEQKQSIIFHSTMKALVEKLEGAPFIRVHRSYIVNINNVTIIERNQLIYDKKRITITEQYRDDFFQQINL